MVQNLYTSRLKQQIFENQLRGFQHVAKVLPNTKSGKLEKIYRGPQMMFPGGLAKLEMLNFEEIFTAIAAVTYAQPAMNAHIDTEGVFVYCDPILKTNNEIDDRLEARNKHLDHLTDTEPNWWLVAGSDARLIIPWQNCWQPNSFCTILIDQIFDEANKVKGWKAIFYSSREVPNESEVADGLKATRLALEGMLSDLGWFERFHIDLDALQGGSLQVGEAAPQMPHYEHSGIHAVLNGWALALGLMLDHTFRSTEDFLGQAADVINLALAGRMSARTILWFFRASPTSASDQQG